MYEWEGGRDRVCVSWRESVCKRKREEYVRERVRERVCV